MANAAEEGHIDIVQLMLDKGADNYNEAMANAAWKGHINIVQLMLDLGATDYNRAMANAASGGQKDLVVLMLDRIVNDYNQEDFNWDNYSWNYYTSAIALATLEGHMDIVRLIKTYENKAYADMYVTLNNTMITAAREGNKDIVFLMLERGANNYDTALDAANIGKFNDIAQLILSYKDRV